MEENLGTDHVGSGRFSVDCLEFLGQCTVTPALRNITAIMLTRNRLSLRTIQKTPSTNRSS